MTAILDQRLFQLKNFLSRRFYGDFFPSKYANLYKSVERMKSQKNPEYITIHCHVAYNRYTSNHWKYLEQSKHIM